MNSKVIRILRRPEVTLMTGLSKSSLQIRINQGTFPPPISLGARAVGFVEHEVEATLRELLKAPDENHLTKFIKDLVSTRTNGGKI
ncbi:helix-turn-helix transcriptional regulator [Shewanella frigidimarina]|uniref:helix-turn-helix transcriptional regulator n=1 Tax=Shewanella frigidimarina TaxID=56812 RepID=UPI003D7BF1EC